MIIQLLAHHNTSVPNKSPKRASDPDSEDDSESSADGGARVERSAPVRGSTPSLFQGTARAHIPAGADASEYADASEGAWRYGPEDWEMQAATKFYDAFAHFGVLPREHAKKEGAQLREELDAWAHIFNKLYRLRDFAVDEIELVYLWLFQTDEKGNPQNWWIQNGTVQSARKLYRKNDEGTRFFDYFLQKAEAELNYAEDREKERSNQEALEEVRRWVESL